MNDFFEPLDLGGEFVTTFFAEHPVMPMAEAMCEIETSGTYPNASVSSIGVVTFDLRSLTMGERFYTTVSDEQTLPEALRALTEFIETYMIAQQARRVWGDVVSPWPASAGSVYRPCYPEILASAYRACNMPVPWTVGAVLCFGTFKYQWPDVAAPVRQSAPYSALDNAVHQVEWLFKIRRTSRGNT